VSTDTSLKPQPSLVAPPRRGSAKRALAIGAGVVLVAASLPLWLITDDYGVGLLLQIAIYAAYGLSWHLLAGYTGQYSFGHAAFFGTGAYVMSLLSYRLDVSPWIGIFVGAAGAAVIGLIVGLIALRLSGLFFGLSTFAVAMILGILATYFVDLTGGAAGMSLPLRVDNPAMLQFDTQVPLFWITLAVAALFLLLTWWILRSRLGLMFRAVRDDAVTAEVSGVNTRKTKIIGLCISAAMAGLVGGLYAQSLLFIDPESGFGMAQSVNAIFVSIIGGMGTLLGPIIGALVFVLLRELGMTVSDGNGVLSVLFYSTIVFIFILAAPKGLAGIGRAIIRRVQAFRSKGDQR
jgi:branched-chain amino acid transport system permease protein